MNSWYGNNVRATWSGIIPEALDIFEVYLSEMDEGPDLELDDEDGSSYHGKSAHFLFCDGHSKLISGHLDIRIFKGLATIRGYERLGEF